MFATTLTTQRLTLRPPCLEDADAIFERYASDPEVTRFLSWPTHTRVQETRDFLAERLGAMAERGETRWVICLRDDPSPPRGMITACWEGRRVELGYYLDRLLWGTGVMTEGVRAVTGEAWRDETVWRVSAYCHVDNVASARVLEKSGFQREGLVRRFLTTPQISDEPQDSYLYAQVRDAVAVPDSP